MDLIPFPEEERAGNNEIRTNKYNENVSKNIIKKVTYVDTVRNQREIKDYRKLWSVETYGRLNTLTIRLVII